MILDRIKEIIKIQKVIEKELDDMVFSKIPEVSKDLGDKLLGMIEDTGNNYRIALSPKITIDPIEQRVTLWLLPRSSCSYIKSGLEKVHIQLSLPGLFGMDDWEMPSLKFRTRVSKRLRDGIKSYLSGLGFSVCLGSGEDCYYYTGESKNLIYSICITK